VLARVPLSISTSVAGWRQTPAADIKLKKLLEEHLDEIARLITQECGKTYVESVGEMRRAIENVDVACVIPTMSQGVFSGGIDDVVIRQPVEVCAIIAHFNFPGMIPFWFLPYALACGNPVIVKPSEKVPTTM
jgi:malonate-semialdehyde dehydrogenase (acetylating) / methylmalonate-semialdehyde dehydrogenase